MSTEHTALAILSAVALAMTFGLVAVVDRLPLPVRVPTLAGAAGMALLSGLLFWAALWAVVV